MTKGGTTERVKDKRGKEKVDQVGLQPGEIQILLLLFSHLVEALRAGG